MKVIKVTDEVYTKLIELAKEMTTQNPRGTRMPHIFQIRDWQRNYDWNLNGDIPCWVHNDGEYTVIETLQDLKDHLQYHDIEEPENLDEIWGDKFDLQNWIEENCEGLKECSYSLEPVYKNAFLTAKSAQAHLDSNYYHYHKDADIYLTHAWRNQEAELITEFLLSLINIEPYKGVIT